MTSKLKWRSTHITAAILGAALLALTARHALVEMAEEAMCEEKRLQEGAA